MINFLIIFVTSCLMLALPVPGHTGQSLDLSTALQTALTQNAVLAASSARAAALGEVPTRAAALPDPTLHLNAMNLPVDGFSTSQEPMTQLQVGIGQRFPFPGKRGLKTVAAERAADAALADHHETRRNVIAEVIAVWWHLFYLERALEVVSNNQNLLRQFVSIAQTKYSVGQGLQQDVLLAQVELSKLLDLTLELEGERDDNAAHLNRLMGWPSEQLLTLPRQAETLLPPVPAVPQLTALAQRQRGKLAAASRRVEMANARLSLAQKDHLPDVTVNAAYGLRSGHNLDGSERADFASLMLSLNLPINQNNRQGRLVAQRQYELDAQRSTEQATQDWVLEEISSAHARYNKARERVNLLKHGIIPQAEQTVASMQAGYQVNKVDFLNLVRAQITFYNYKTRYWQILASAKGTLAQLEAAVGGPLPGNPESKEDVQ